MLAIPNVKIMNTAQNAFKTESFPGLANVIITGFSTKFI